MPTLLAIAGSQTAPSKPFDGKNAWATLAEGRPSPHEDLLINVELYRGAIRKGPWKLVKTATLPGKTELFDLSKDAGEKNNVAEQNPEVVKDLEARLVAYARQQQMSLWFKAQRPSSGRRRRPRSIRASTSTMAACRAKGRRCRASERQGYT